MSTFQFLQEGEGLWNCLCAALESGEGKHSFLHFSLGIYPMCSYEQVSTKMVDDRESVAKLTFVSGSENTSEGYL